MNKNSIRGIFALTVFMVVGSIAFGAVISSPAATVNLTKNVVITTDELNKEVENYKAVATQQGADPATINALNILNIMINDELWRQGAARDGVVISDAQINQYIKEWRSQMEQQVGRAMTDAEYKTLVEGYYGTEDAFKQTVRDQMLVSGYVAKVRPNLALDVKQPSTAEVNSFYRQNKSQFVNPENVKINHIFIPFATGDNAEAENAKNKALLEQVARYINYGTTTFEKAVQEYSQDASSKNIGGAIGWLTMDDTTTRDGLGEEFFNTAFDTEVGKISPVVTSNSGYHILKVMVHNDFKLLGIDDTINPESTVTVRQYITSGLLSQNQETAYANAIQSIISDLRDQATVRIMYK